MRVRKAVNIVVAVCLSILLMGFTLPEYQDGQALVDEQELLVEGTHTTLSEYYTQYLTEVGVKVITVLDTGVETEQISNALDGMESSWQLSRSVLVLINPETGGMSYKVTQDIAIELGDIGSNIDRLREHVVAGLVDEGLIDFYQKFPAGRITYADTEVNGGTYESKQLEAPRPQDTGFFADFTLVDWVSVGLFGVILIGGIGYAMYNMSITRALERDIAIFNSYLVQNPDHSRRDIWEQLQYDKEIKHSYRDYKEYMAERSINKK